MIEWGNISKETIKVFCEEFDTQFKEKNNRIEKAFKSDCVHDRVSVLNNEYRTHMGAEQVNAVAKRIEEEKLDSLILNCDINVVSILADKKKSKGKSARDCFSFATKYCCLLSTFNGIDYYPIFDSLVYKALLCLNWKYGNPFDISEKLFKDILKKREYPKYKEIIEEFRSYGEFGISDVSFRNLDKYLWWNPVFVKRINTV